MGPGEQIRNPERRLLDSAGGRRGGKSDTTRRVDERMSKLAIVDNVRRFGRTPASVGNLAQPELDLQPKRAPSPRPGAPGRSPAISFGIIRRLLSR
eukprot:1195371-Prorocentrum_minimum.AAC.4